MAVLAWTAVMVEEPPPITVKVLPSMVATAPFELVYVKAPSLLVVGGTKLKAALPSALDSTEKLVKMVVIGFTVKLAVIVPDVYLDVLAWSAVMIEEPAPTMVIVLPSTVATAPFELEYVIKPSPLVVGATKLKAELPNVFVGTEKLDRTVVI